MAGMCLGSLALAALRLAAGIRCASMRCSSSAIGASGLLMLVVMPLVQRIYTAIVGHGVAGLLLRGAVRGDLPAAADADDGRDAAGDRALGRDHAARRLLAGLLLRRQHARRGVRLPARRLLSAARPRHGDRDVRRRRAQLRGRRGSRCALARDDAARRARAGVPARRTARATPTARGRLRRDRAVGPQRAGRRGGLDAAVVAAARRHDLHVLDHPGGVPDRLGLGSSAGSALVARRARRARRARLAQLLLVAAVALGGGTCSPTRFPTGRSTRGCRRAPGSSSRSISCAASGRSCPRPSCGGPASRSRSPRSRRRARTAARLVGRVYAANTVGAIVGAVVVSLVLISADRHPERASGC